MTLTIRPGRDDDGPGYIALIGTCWAEYPGIVFDVDNELPELRAFATYKASRGGAVWSADQDGTIVGMAATYPTDDSWTLSRLYLLPSHRGTGLGGALLGTAEAHARRHQARRMTLWTDVLFTRAHAFYEKHGYVRRGGLRTLHDLSNTIEANYEKPLTGLVIGTLDVASAESAERPLSAILRANVGDGASLGFMPPLDDTRARAYWRSITRSVGTGEVKLYVAWLDGVLCGTVQLALAMPDNQPHRAEIRKLMVCPGQRRRGIGRGLMLAAEAGARAAGRRLLVLDTLADGEGEGLYRSLGWTAAGTIPGYALDAAGTAHATRYFYKAL